MIKPIIPFAELNTKHNNYIFYYEVGYKSKEIKLTQFVPFLMGPINYNKNGGSNKLIENESKLIFSGYLGDLLIDYLNSYNDIIHCLKDYKVKISACSLEDVDNKDDVLSVKYIKQLGDDLQDFSPNTYLLLSNLFSNFIYYIDITIVNYLHKVLELINNSSRVTPPIDDNGTPQWNVSKYEKHYDEIASLNFLQAECIEFIDDLISSLSKLKEKVDNAFVYGKEATKFYSGSDVRLPICKVSFNDKKHPTVKDFSYKFYTLFDLVDIDLYHISLIEKSIKQCKNCNKYFVTLNNNRTEYCSNIFNKQTGKTCKEIGALLQFGNKYSKNSPYFKLYETIYNRLNKSEKYSHTELFDFTSAFSDLKYTGKSDTEIWIWLTEYDKKFQKEHPVKRGHPYSSSKYWYK